jgi:hypothetical protein
MTPRTLIDYAINTGHFYNRHLRLTRDNAPPSVWARYIRADLLPHYRREMHEPYDGLSTVEIDLVANELKFYYGNHVQEANADAQR